ncbi:PLRG1 [Mytilus edulis]|uniref:PLRG1 n=1 Tax=Mytilus edulis TaxID=6550 RepID=A0A8S3TFW0_MYTED|nr:PLRG1 [Mytilus edulis]
MFIYPCYCVAPDSVVSGHLGGSAIYVDSISGHMGGCIYPAIYMWHQTCFISGHLGWVRVPATHVAPDVYIYGGPTKITISCYTCSTCFISETSGRGALSCYTRQDIWEGAYILCFITRRVHLRDMGGSIYPANLDRRVHLRTSGRVHISCYTRRVLSHDIWEMHIS